MKFIRLLKFPGLQCIGRTQRNVGRLFLWRSLTVWLIHSNTCRLAFHGRLVEAFTDKVRFLSFFFHQEREETIIVSFQKKAQRCHWKSSTCVQIFSSHRRNKMQGLVHFCYRLSEQGHIVLGHTGLLSYLSLFEPCLHNPYAKCCPNYSVVLRASFFYIYSFISWKSVFFFFLTVYILQGCPDS